MPKLEQWAKFPKQLRQHLIERMANRSITIEDLNHLRLWVESDPDVPLGEWYKDFGSFSGTPLFNNIQDLPKSTEHSVQTHDWRGFFANVPTETG